MQRGKLGRREGIEAAVMVPATMEEGAVEAGVRKVEDRWARMGERRSSSSRRGKAREVCC
jgi:hypothetical protein